ncbi:MAG: 2-C-methyl-D-erythritol 4-phosphate cytidylyltransferase [Brevinematales bacterium]|nr:2-C-methyl-D-erythritol 4-phosphate cytidylyltransferase [Brevinematales bacterium]
MAIVLASGKGERFGHPLPKQFVEFRGRKIIEYSLQQFEYNNFVDEIIVVSHSDYTHIVKEIGVRFKKFSGIAIGGSTRSISSKSGVFSVKHKDSYILIHDSARPLFSQYLINNLLENVEETGAVIPVISSTDTLVEAEDGFVKSVLDRNKILRVQTPQCFKYEIIFEAYKKFKDDIIDFPDDSSVVLYTGLTKIKLIKGETTNLKITNYEDMKILDVIYKSE